MVEQFRRRFGLENDALDPDELSQAEEHARERFGSPAWTHYLP
jgi:lipoate-protein ligase A